MATLQFSSDTSGLVVSAKASCRDTCESTPGSPPLFVFFVASCNQLTLPSVPRVFKHSCKGSKSVKNGGSRTMLV